MGESKNNKYFRVGFSEPSPQPKCWGEGSQKMKFAMNKQRVLWINLMIVIFGVLVIRIYPLMSMMEVARSRIPKGTSTIKGRIIAEDTGKWIGSTVVIGIEDSEYRSGGSRSTDTEGHYQIKNLPPGKYKIIVQFGLTDDPYVEQSDYTTIWVTVKPGAKTIYAPDIVLRRAGKITGRVLRADGAPFKDKEVFNVEVSYVYKGIKNWSSAHLGIAGARLGKDGSYIINGIPPIKNGCLIVISPGYMNTKVFGAINVIAGKTTSGLDITVPTNDPTGIQGIITEQQSGRPITTGALCISMQIGH